MNIAIEYNPSDSRIKYRKDGTVQTLTARMGTGGNTQPLVLHDVIPINYDAGRGGRIDISKEEVAQTLTASMGEHSNNVPLVGVPVYATSRPHFHTVATEDYVNTLAASDSHDGHMICAPIDPSKYVLRRLTPTECGRLQGFPDGWCKDLTTEDPDDNVIDFFQAVWDHWNDLRGKKHKTRNQVIKWLKTEPTDAAQYKMWGNGVSLPIPEYIMDSIQEVVGGNQ